MQGDPPLYPPLAIADTGRLPLIGRVKVDQVDVGRKVQLPATEFPHAEDRQLRFLATLLEKRHAVLGHQQAAALLARYLESGGGQGRQFRRNLFQGRKAAQIPGGNTEHLPVFEPAQQGEKALVIASGRNPSPQGGQHLRLATDKVDGTLDKNLGERAGVATDDVGQEGGGAQQG